MRWVAYRTRASGNWKKVTKVYLQEEEDADPFAVRERNVFKEYWDDFVGWLYSLRAKQQMGSQAS
jgi:hypothetical protein